jgi:hypothetical protein
MRTIRMVALSLAIHAGLAAPAAADTYVVRSDSSIRTLSDPWLRRGAPIRVRIQDAAAPVIGTFEGVAGDSLRLRENRAGGGALRLAIPLRAVRGLELGRERAPRTWRGFAIGFLACAAGGAAMGALSSEKGDRTAGAIVMGMLFAPIGSLIGSLIGSSDRAEVWVQAPIPDGSSERSNVEAPARSDTAGTTGGER